MNRSLKEHAARFFEQGIRFDGRKLDEYRDITIEYGISKSAEGSAKVQIGETQVLAGVKLSMEKPFPDTPDEGTLMVNVELVPMANPEFETGPPGIDAIELARVVDRGIREAKAIDTTQLCIKSGEKCWGVLIDVIPINDAGNLFDAASLAAIAALLDAKFPEFDGTTVDYKTRTDKGLTLTKRPLGVTVIKSGNHLFVDPTDAEEEIIDARLTVVTEESGIICALQKGGEGALTLEEVEAMLELGSAAGAKLQELFNNR